MTDRICPFCSGDCAGANPPVVNCPVGSVSTRELAYRLATKYAHAITGDFLHGAKVTFSDDGLTLLVDSLLQALDTVPRSRYDACNRDWLDEKRLREECVTQSTLVVERLRGALDSAKAAIWDSHYGHGIAVEYARAVTAEIDSAVHGLAPTRPAADSLARAIIDAILNHPIEEPQTQTIAKIQVLAEKALTL